MTSSSVSDPPATAGPPDVTAAVPPDAADSPPAMAEPPTAEAAAFQDGEAGTEGTEAPPPSAPKGNDGGELTKPPIEQPHTVNEGDMAPEVGAGLRAPGAARPDPRASRGNKSARQRQKFCP